MQKRKNPLKDDLARGEGVRQSGAPKSEKTNQNNKGVRHSGVVQCCCRAWLFSRFEFVPLVLHDRPTATPDWLVAEDLGGADA
jgi:hypothetical protein